MKTVMMQPLVLIYVSLNLVVKRLAQSGAIPRPPYRANSGTITYTTYNTHNHQASHRRPPHASIASKQGARRHRASLQPRSPL
jgi:hypothetical protein